MYGAILGDMIGAPYEFDRGNKTKEFPLFGRGTEFTDDTVMTVAVAEALLDAAEAGDNADDAAGAEAIRPHGRAEAPEARHPTPATERGPRPGRIPEKRRRKAFWNCPSARRPT